MKKIFCMLLSIVLIIGVTGCSLDNSSKKAQNSKYYSILKEQKNNLVFNLNLDEFVKNYNNKVKEVGKSDLFLDSDDFNNINTGALFFNPVESEWYGVERSTHSMVVGVNNDSITGVVLLATSQENVADLLINLVYVLEALNPEYTTGNVAPFMTELLKPSELFNVVYQKGIAIYSGFPDGNVILGAEAITEEQKKTAK